MITNKIISILISITAIIVIPIQFVTTFVLGFFVAITFGLLLIPISLIWAILFLGPLLGFSYVYERVAITRPLIFIIGIPLAVIADIYVALMPSMGEMDSRFEKMIVCQTFPYTWKYIQFQKGKLNIGKEDVLAKILREVSKAKPLNEYLDRLRADAISRPDKMKGNDEIGW